MNRLKDKKGVNLAVVMLILACFSMAAAGLAQLYAARSYGEKAKDAIDESDAYNQMFLTVINTDLDADYPETPDGVMDFYDDTTLLLYSGALTEPEMVESVLTKQRQLYAPELLALNTMEDQFAALLASAEEAARKRISIVQIERVDMFFDRRDPNMAVFNTIMRLDGEADLYFNYYLKKGEDGRWRVILRDSVNRNFERP